MPVYWIHSHKLKMFSIQICGPKKDYFILPVTCSGNEAHNLINASMWETKEDMLENGMCSVPFPIITRWKIEAQNSHRADGFRTRCNTTAQQSELENSVECTAICLPSLQEVELLHFSCPVNMGQLTPQTYIFLFSVLYSYYGFLGKKPSNIVRVMRISWLKAKLNIHVWATYVSPPWGSRTNL